MACPMRRPGWRWLLEHAFWGPGRALQAVPLPPQPVFDALAFSAAAAAAACPVTAPPAAARPVEYRCDGARASAYDGNMAARRTVLETSGDDLGVAEAAAGGRRPCCRKNNNDALDSDATGAERAAAASAGQGSATVSDSPQQSDKYEDDDFEEETGEGSCSCGDSGGGGCALSDAVVDVAANERHAGRQGGADGGGTVGSGPDAGCRGCAGRCCDGECKNPACSRGGSGGGGDGRDGRSDMASARGGSSGSDGGGGGQDTSGHDHGNDGVAGGKSGGGGGRGDSSGDAASGRQHGCAGGRRGSSSEETSGGSIAGAGCVANVVGSGRGATSQHDTGRDKVAAAAAADARALLLHAADKEVPPIVEDDGEEFEAGVIRAAAALGLPLLPEGLSQRELENVLVTAYKMMMAPLPLRDMLALLMYLGAACRLAPVASLVVNSAFATALARPLRQHRSPELRAASARTLGIAVRHATYIAPAEAAGLAEALAICLCEASPTGDGADGGSGDADAAVAAARAGTVAALGELLFYIATAPQPARHTIGAGGGGSGSGGGDDTGSVRSAEGAVLMVAAAVPPPAACAALLHALDDGEEAAVQLVAVRTLENILARAPSSWAIAFVADAWADATAQRLWALASGRAVRAPPAALRTGAAAALSHLLRHAVLGPAAVAGAADKAAAMHLLKLFGRMQRRCELADAVVYGSMTGRGGRGLLNMLNLVLLVALEGQHAQHDSDAAASVALAANLLVARGLVSRLLALADSADGGALLRAKAILALRLLCAVDLGALAEIARGRRLVGILERALNDSVGATVTAAATADHDDDVPARADEEYLSRCSLSLADALLRGMAASQAAGGSATGASPAVLAVSAALAPWAPPLFRPLCAALASCCFETRHRAIEALLVGLPACMDAAERQAGAAAAAAARAFFLPRCAALLADLPPVPAKALRLLTELSDRWPVDSDGAASGLGHALLNAGVMHAPVACVAPSDLDVEKKRGGSDGKSAAAAAATTDLEAAATAAVLVVRLLSRGDAAFGAELALLGLPERSAAGIVAAVERRHITAAFAALDLGTALLEAAVFAPPGRGPSNAPSAVFQRLRLEGVPAAIEALTALTSAEIAEGSKAAAEDHAVRAAIEPAAVRFLVQAFGAFGHRTMDAVLFGNGRGDNNGNRNGRGSNCGGGGGNGGGAGAAGLPLARAISSRHVAPETKACLLGALEAAASSGGARALALHQEPLLAALRSSAASADAMLAARASRTLEAALLAAGQGR
ncbi:unnamed protein product [Phaeothamnion confervicola]